jgi:hypothetical protein
MYCWRARASKYRGKVDDPLTDTGIEMKTGRVRQTQMNNPDSEELWRVTVEIYRSENADSEGRMTITAKSLPIERYQTYVCTAHR